MVIGLQAESTVAGAGNIGPCGVQGVDQGVIVVLMGYAGTVLKQT